MNGYEKRTEAKKKKVIEATFNLINTEAGADAITMNDVAEASGVSKTSVFKYFGSKNELLHEVYTDFLYRIGDDTIKIIDSNLPFEDTLMAISQAEIQHLNKVNKQFYLDLMKHATEKNDVGIAKTMEEYTKQSYDLMLDLFHRGRKEGKVDLKYSDEFLLLYFQAMVEGVSIPHIYERILPYTNEWMELLIKGVAPSK